MELHADCMSFKGQTHSGSRRETNPRHTPRADARLKSVRYKASVHVAVLPPSGTVDTNPAGPAAFICSGPAHAEEQQTADKQLKQIY